MTGKKKTILICDDEEGIRESFRLILDADFNLTFANNGLEALELLKNFTPDLMLLDIKMPKAHGMDILKQVKELKPKMPVIIVTGYQSVEMAQEAARYGVSDYIPKPFDTNQIIKAIKRSLSESP